MITVDRVELRLVRLPLQHGFRTSSHSKDVLEHILVRAESRDGAVGWGECASPSDPYFGPENVETCWLMLRDYFAAGLVGREWETPDEAAAFGARVRGNAFARAGLDIACWDVWARTRGASVAAELGATASEIESGVSLGIEASVEELLDQVGRFIVEKYARIKLKIAPGWDVVPVAAVRERFGDISLQVDANGAYGRADAEQLRKLDAFDLQMIEQPFAPADLVAHADLQARMRTPICLDESIDDVATLDAVLRLGAARVVNLKVSRLGGLGPARAAHDRCRVADVPAWCGGMHEFGVGRAANIALAALPGCTLPSDVSGSAKYYRADVVAPPIVAHAGRVLVPYERPGLGHDVLEDVVAEHCVRTTTIVSRG